jgi:hypothetical protein
MTEQIHKRLTDGQMKIIVEKYLAKELREGIRGSVQSDP